MHIKKQGVYREARFGNQLVGISNILMKLEKNGMYQYCHLYDTQQ